MAEGEAPTETGGKGPEVTDAAPPSASADESSEAPATNTDNGNGGRGAPAPSASADNSSAPANGNDGLGAPIPSASAPVCGNDGVAAPVGPRHGGEFGSSLRRPQSSAFFKSFRSRGDSVRGPSLRERGASVSRFIADGAADVKQTATKEGKQAWVRSFPSKLRLLRGTPKYIAGCALQSCLLLVFFVTLGLVLSDCNDTRYVTTLDNTKDTDTQEITCYQPAREITASYEVTEDNVWSNAAQTFQSKDALKQVDFLAYQSPVEDHTDRVKQINECIGENNAFTSNHTSIFNLMHINFNPCMADNMTVSTPIHWPFVFDSTLVRLSHPDLRAQLDAGDISFKAVSEACRTTAGRSGDVIDLQVDCSPACRNLSAYADTICGDGFYSGFPGDNKTVTPITINPDSMARCLAVNHGILEWDYVDDLNVITTVYNDAGAPAFIVATYADTEYSNELALEGGACDLHFKGYDQTTEYPSLGDGPLVWLRPTVEYDNDLCNRENFCGANVSTLDCDFTFDSYGLRVNLTEFYTGAQVVLNTKGNLQGLLNTNQFTFLTSEQGPDDNPACRPLITPLPTSTPESLLESFFDCDGQVCPSTLSSVGEAFANATLVEELLLILVVAVGIYLMRKTYRWQEKRNKTVSISSANATLMDYEDEDVELAMWEAGVERIRLKERVQVPADKLFFHRKSMRGMGHEPDAQAWEDETGEPWVPEM